MKLLPIYDPKRKCDLNKKEKKLFLKKILDFLTHSEIIKGGGTVYWSKSFKSSEKDLYYRETVRRGNGKDNWINIKEGIVFHKTNEGLLLILRASNQKLMFSLCEYRKSEKFGLDLTFSSINNYNNKLIQKSFNLNEDEYIFLDNFNLFYNRLCNHFYEKKLIENDKIQLKILNHLKEFDKDNNGKLDVIEVNNDFDILIEKYQSDIIKIDSNKSYLLDFVKISEYQKNNRINLQTMFNSILKLKNESEIIQSVKLLREQIESYELLLFHSLNMIASLINGDQLTFYKIYVSFDKLNIFNSNHQNELIKKLNTLELSVVELINSVKSMEDNIINELQSLNFSLENKFDELSKSLNSSLISINSSVSSIKSSNNNIQSSVGLNNLLTFYNIFQTSLTNRRLNS